MSDTKTVKPEQKATFGPSLLVFILVVAVIFTGILVLGLDAHVPITFACAIVMIYSLVLHIPYKELEAAMIKTISESVVVLMILVCIGMLVAAWMAAGTVPYIIDIGLKLLAPSVFLLFVAAMCAVLSSLTGSSWTTCATIGVAFMGISIGLGIPVAITAGAVASGAYFGDKQSPISDFCIYAAGVCKVDIYKHARRMLWTTGPAFAISCVLFLVISLGYGGGESYDATAVENITGGLESAFKMGIPTLIPLAALIVFLILKMPSIPSLFLAALVGALVAVFYQGMGWSEIFGAMMNGFSVDSEVAEVTRICNRGGIGSMSYVIELMIVSLAMAGLFTRSGLLNAIVEKMERLIRNRVGLVSTSIVTAFVGHFLFCDPYMAAIVPVKAFGKRYEELGIDKCVLSRSISDGALVTCPMVPWGSSGVFTATTLGVETLKYLPYYFMWCTPIVGIVLAFLGLGIYKYDYDADPEGQKAEAL